MGYVYIPDNVKPLELFEIMEENIKDLQYTLDRSGKGKERRPFLYVYMPVPETNTDKNSRPWDYNHLHKIDLKEVLINQIRDFGHTPKDFEDEKLEMIKKLEQLIEFVKAS